MIKTYLKCYGYLFGMIFILTILLTIINYFSKMPVQLLKAIIPLISLLISSIFLGKNVKEKGYIEGIKFSSLYLIFITLLNFIFKTGFNYKTFIVYILFIICGIVGAMIGINMKRQNL